MKEIPVCQMCGQPEIYKTKGTVFQASELVRSKIATVYFADVPMKLHKGCHALAYAHFTDHVKKMIAGWANG